MQRAQLTFRRGFVVVPGNMHSQAATMTLAPGETEGGPENRHRGSDQWLYVVAGRGTAVLDGTPHQLAPGTLLFIERGRSHEIRNEGDEPLKTLNVYVPPAYSPAGGTLPPGEP